MPIETGEWNDLIDCFIQIRSECKALQLVFPDENAWRKFLISPSIIDKAHHDSYFLIALDRGQLSIFTEPIHRFLIDPKGQRNINSGYIQSIREFWAIERYTHNDEDVDAIIRHRKGKQFAGKLYELIFAQYLEKIGHEVVDLEAWEGNARRPDISTLFHGKKYSFEVKYVGQDEYEFINTYIKRKAAEFDPYRILNYIMFRICHASFQLNWCKTSSRHIAVILLDPSSSPKFDFVHEKLCEAFDISESKFYRSSDLMYNELFKDENEPLKSWIQECLETPSKILNVLDGVWIYSINTQTKNSCLFEKKYEYQKN
jgi:hypothetical protein